MAYLKDDEPPLTARLKRWTRPLRSQEPLFGHVGSEKGLPSPSTSSGPRHLLKVSPVGSPFGPTWPMLLRPNVRSAVQMVGPSVPCLVKIWITPPDASVPYS